MTQKKPGPRNSWESRPATVSPGGQRKISPPICSYYPLVAVNANSARTYQEENRAPANLGTNAWRPKLGDIRHTHLPAGRIHTAFALSM
jgi:hypothetical protein